MSREPKKRPGDIARARSRHVRRQAIQDAITAAAATPGIPVPLDMNGTKWELTGLRPTEPLEGQCLVRNSGKKLLIGYVCEKDGIFIDAPNGGRFFCHRDAVLGYVRPSTDAT